MEEARDLLTSQSGRPVDLPPASLMLPDTQEDFFLWFPVKPGREGMVQLKEMREDLGRGLGPWEGHRRPFSVWRLALGRRKSMGTSQFGLKLTCS